GTGCEQPPLLHTSPGAQSVSTSQDVRQLLPSGSQRYGSQLAGGGMTQVALPLHFGALMSALSAQNSTPQVTVASGSTQDVPFVPSQYPPQALEPGHA